MTLARWPNAAASRRRVEQENNYSLAECGAVGILRAPANATS